MSWELNSKEQKITSHEDWEGNETGDDAVRVCLDCDGCDRTTKVIIVSGTSGKHPSIMVWRAGW